MPAGCTLTCKSRLFNTHVTRTQSLPRVREATVLDSGKVLGVAYAILMPYLFYRCVGLSVPSGLFLASVGACQVPLQVPLFQTGAAVLQRMPFPRGAHGARAVPVVWHLCTATPWLSTPHLRCSLRLTSRRELFEARSIPVPETWGELLAVSAAWNNTVVGLGALMSWSSGVLPTPSPLWSYPVSGFSKTHPTHA